MEPRGPTNASRPPMIADNGRELVGIREGARRLGVSPPTVTNWVNNDKIPVVEVPVGQSKKKLLD